MGRVKGRDINLSGAPTKVSDMKNGELILAEDGILGRVGDQVLIKEWFKTLLYDDFEDGIVDPAWDNVYSWKSGGSHVETGGNMIVTVNQGASGGTYSLDQTGILGVGDPIAVPGTFNFDVYGKMTANPSGAQQGNYGSLEFNFWDNAVAKDYIRVQLQTWNANTEWRPCMTWKNDSNAYSVYLTPVDYGPGANELWWRFRYMPSQGDTYIKAWWHHGPENPLDSPYDTGWTPVGMSKYYPIPDGNDELRVRLYAFNTGNNGDESFYFNKIAKWDTQHLTTTTTTTTAP